MPLSPQCTHLLMAASSRIKCTVSQSLNHLKCFLELDNEFSVLKRPPRSPDLTPTEHLQDVVQWEILIMDVEPTNLQQLFDAVMSTWTKNSEESFQHLVGSVPWTIKASLKAKRCPTKYYPNKMATELFLCTKIECVWILSKATA